jgi:hypothetical protein
LEEAREQMQKWEYLQVCRERMILHDWHPLHGRTVWIDSRGRMGPLDTLEQEVRGLDRRGREQTFRVGVNDQDWARVLNELGEDGWELVTKFGGDLMLKRPKE